jgi:DNA-binding NarL/FixJ family response regulator
VFQDDTFDELLKNIRMAGKDDAMLEAPSATRLMPHLVDLVDLDRPADTECGGPEALTRREWEVLTLIQQGQTNQEIAEALVIELGTAKNHVHNILRKLNVNSRRDAAHVSKLVSFRGWRGEKASRPYQYAASLS